MAIIGARTSGYARQGLQESYGAFSRVMEGAKAAGLKPVCANGYQDPELWFSDDRRLEARAKVLCFTCPVREECLSHAMEHEEYGVWGGLNRLERRTLKLRAERGWR